jgi:hypothetical protein
MQMNRFKINQEDAVTLSVVVTDLSHLLFSKTFSCFPVIKLEVKSVQILTQWLAEGCRTRNSFHLKSSELFITHAHQV